MKKIIPIFLLLIVWFVVSGPRLRIAPTRKASKIKIEDELNLYDGRDNVEDALQAIASGDVVDNIKGNLTISGNFYAEGTIGCMGKATADVVEVTSYMEILGVDPYLKLSPTVGDPFHFYAYANELYCTNFTDGTIWRVSDTNMFEVLTDLRVGMNQTLYADISTGKVGVGNASPTHTLTVGDGVDGANVKVLADSGGARLIYDSEGTAEWDFYVYSDTYNPYIWHTRSRGTREGPLALVDTDLISYYGCSGNDGSDPEAGNADMDFIVDGTVSTGIVPIGVLWNTTDTSGVYDERVRIDPDGNVGIGTATPLYDLDVRGADTASQLHFADSDNDDGGYLTSANTNNFFLSAGAIWNGSAWVAKSTIAEIIGGSQTGAIQFYTDSSLTGGSTFTPTLQVVVENDGDLVVQNGNVLQVNSAGDDKNATLEQNDTDTVLTSSSGQINLVPATIVTTTAVIRGTTSLWYNEYHLGASQTSPGASGATEAELNAVFSWNLDAITEYLYYAADIHDDWDAATDVEIEVTGYLGEAETADDLIRMSVLCSYGTDHDNANTFKTQTLDVDHDIVSDNAQFDVHTIPFTFNFDEEGNVLEIGDTLHLRVYLDDVTSAPVVTDFNVSFVTIKYKSASVRIEVD